MNFSCQLAARDLLYAPFHRHVSTYNGLCYISCEVLAGMRNSSMGIFKWNTNLLDGVHGATCWLYVFGWDDSLQCDVQCGGVGSSCGTTPPLKQLKRQTSNIRNVKCICIYLFTYLLTYLFTDLFTYIFTSTFIYLIIFIKFKFIKTYSTIVISVFKMFVLKKPKGLPKATDLSLTTRLKI